MPLFFSIQIFPEEFIHALSWTLIHSMWQGMLLSIVAGAIVFFTKKNSPALRYNLMAGSLLIFMIAVGSTFGFQILKASQGVNVPQTIPTTQVMSMDPVMSPADASIKLFIPAKAIDFFNAHAGWIVLMWLLIMGLRCIRLTLGLYSVYRLKRIQVFNAGEYWNSRINELSRQLQINKPVRLLRSGIAKVPAVIGYFSPVILFPASMLTALQADEVEAILIHELAHIRRQDFLVNMFQNIIEIIFFFNPAVLWVSSLIKAERENCCDDIAVMQTGGKRNYINALMAFGELNLQQASPLTNAFAGKNNHLINRVKRIIYNNNKTLSNMEKKVLAAGMILTGVFIFAFSSNIAQQKAKEKTTVVRNSDVVATDIKSADLIKIIDTIPGADVDRKEISNETIHTTVNGKKYKMVSHNGQVDELDVNDKKIPADQIGRYKSVTEKIIVQSKIDRERSEKDMIESKNDMEEAKREQAEAQNEMAEANIEMERSRKEMEQDMEQSRKEIEESKKEMQKDMEQSKKEMEESKKEMQQALQQNRKQMEYAKLEMEKSKKDMADAKLQMEHSQKDMMLHKEQAKREMEQGKKQMEQSRTSMEQSKHEMEQSKRDEEEIIKDFVKENVIKDKKDLFAYELSNDELIVNGVKQPDAIHKKFKDKYVKGKDWTRKYNYNAN
ncbi:MAG TPA: M56 family metallopeptidase [Chitinophagaceae bacterium]|nr:M56 family metallopeptidase [Chitinophagaceae bacterium]